MVRGATDVNPFGSNRESKRCVRIAENPRASPSPFNFQLIWDL
jgi:hypothetical protein